MPDGSEKLGQHRFTSYNAVVEFHFDLRVRRQIYIRARSELDQTDALSARHHFPCLDIGHDSSSDDSCDQPDGHPFTGWIARLKAEQYVFVVRGTFDAHGVHELSRRILKEGNLAAQRRIL